LSSTDGVGTKLKLAIELNEYSNLGIDLVAMCVNDILVNGGEPVFFLDYMSSSKINNKVFLELIKSINNGCNEAGCSLIGGETAEMPGMYKRNDFDIAGFSVGVVERDNLIEKEKVKNGDLIYGIESNGFHSNGYSLIRKVLKSKKVNLMNKCSYETKAKDIGSDLLKPTKIYVKMLLPLIKKKLINGMAHITGGGILDNLERILPRKLEANIHAENYSIHPRFLWLSRIGNISKSEMIKTFNCGIGMIIIVDKKNKRKIDNYFIKNKINIHKLGYISNQKNVKNRINFLKLAPWY